MNKLIQNYWVEIFLEDADLNYLISESPDSLEFDVAEAISCFIHDYQEENNVFYLYLSKLLRDNNFSASLKTSTLEETGKKIYDELAQNYSFYEEKFENWYADEELKGNKVLENTINDNDELPDSLEDILNNSESLPDGQFKTYYFNTDIEMNNVEALSYFFEKTGIPSTLIDGTYAEYDSNDSNLKYYFNMSGGGDMYSHVLEVEIVNKTTPDIRHDENIIYTSFLDFEKAYEKLNIKNITEDVENIENAEDNIEDVNLNDNIAEFDIPEWAVEPLINNDWTALNDEEGLKLSKFIYETSMEYGNCGFYMGDSDRPEFKHSNAIDNLGCNVYKLYIKITKNNK